MISKVAHGMLFESLYFICISSNKFREIVLDFANERDKSYSERSEGSGREFNTTFDGMLQFTMFCTLNLLAFAVARKLGLYITEIVKVARYSPLNAYHMFRDASWVCKR